MPRSVALSAMAVIISARGCACNEEYRRGMSESLLSLFPPDSSLASDGMLMLAGCRADALAAEFGTPVLVVSETALRARAREYAGELAARWPRSRVVFASKAFPCTAVQRVMVEEGLGLDVAGGGEIVTALAAGADPAIADDLYESPPAGWAEHGGHGSIAAHLRARGG